MKKFTLMIMAAFAVLIANAAAPVKQSRMLSLQDGVAPVAMTNVKKAPKGLVQKSLSAKARAPRKAEATAASIAGNYVWNYATYSGQGFSSQPDTLETTPGEALVKISAVEEKADSVVVSGMAPAEVGANVISANGNNYLQFSLQTFTTSYGNAAFYGVFYYEGDEQNEAGWYYDQILGIIAEDGSISFPMHWMQAVLVDGDYAGYSLSSKYVMGSKLVPDSFVPNTTLVALPEGAEVAEMPMTGKYYADFNAYNGEESTDLATNVKVAKVGDDIYVQGILVDFPEAWIKGTIAEGEVEVPVTYVGATQNGGNAYVCGYSRNGIVPTYFTYKEELGSLELDGYMMLTPDERELNLNTVFGIYEALYIGERPATVEVPEDLVTEDMPVEGTMHDGQSQSAFTATVKVGVDGQNVYVQGLVDQVPEGWIMGTFNEDRTEVVFPAGQYVGAGEYGSVYVVGEESFVDEETGEEDVKVGDIIFTYNEAKNLYELQNNLYINGKEDDFYYYSILLAGMLIGENCDEVWVAANQGYSDKEGVTEIKIGETITGTIDKADGKNDPTYYTNGEALRLYANNVMTITSEKLMGKIVITMTGSAKQKSLEANVGTYALEGNVGTWTGEANEVVFTVPSASGSQARIQKISIYYFDYATTLVEVPENLEVEPYAFKATDTYYNKEVTKNVKVGFDGDKVYFQGLSDLLPESWVRGTLAEDGTVTVPNWYLGVYESYFGNYDVVFSGANFAYDKDADKFTCEGFETYAGESPMDEFADVTLTKIVEVAATPADPSVTKFNGTGSYPSVKFDIPMVDVDGNQMVTEKLSYVIWFEKDGEQQQLTLTTDLYSELTEDMTEIPYDFTDSYDIYAGGSTVYLNQDITELQSWTKIGVQSIYRGAGEEHKSNIGWYDLAEYWVAVGIADVKATQNANVIFDLQGRRVAQPTKGLYIVNGKKVVIK